MAKKGSRKKRKKLASVGTIGFLGSITHKLVDSTGKTVDSVAAFGDGVKSTGLTWGTTNNADVKYIHKTANGKYKDLASQAGYLIGRGVDLIVATGGIVAAQAAAHAAAQADSPVPVLYIVGRLPRVTGDPLDDLTASSHTGINLDTTGQNFTRITKIKEKYGAAVAKKVALVINANAAMSSSEKQDWGSVRYTATYDPQGDNDDGGFKTKFEAVLQDAIDNGKAQAIVLSADPFFNSKRSVVTKAVNAKGLQACYPFKEFVLDGSGDGHLSYGPSLYDTYFLLGSTAVDILKLNTNDKQNIRTLIPMDPPIQEDCWVP